MCDVCGFCCVQDAPEKSGNFRVTSLRLLFRFIMSSMNCFGVFFGWGASWTLRMLLKAALAGSGEWNVCSHSLFFFSF